LALEIADALLPDAKWLDEANERRFLNQGGLTVKGRKHVWFSHSAGQSGGPIELVQFVKQCTRKQATQWVAAWLLKHAGIGKGGDASGGEDADIENGTLAVRIIDRLADATGTIVETYLKSRGLSGSPPECRRPRLRTCCRGLESERDAGRRLDQRRPGSYRGV
jgi:hypothetical protein